MDGPVDAIFSAISEAIPHEASLELYQVQAITHGSDAQAIVVVRLKQNNQILTTYFYLKILQILVALTKVKISADPLK